MAKTGGPHLRALQSPRNGRPARRTVTARAANHASNGRPSMRRLVSGLRGLRVFRGIGRAIGEVFAMALVLALSIVLAHVLLLAMFPV